MAADLLESSPVFRAAIEACAKALKPKGVDLMAEFARPEGWSAPALAMAGLSATQARSLAPLLGCMVPAVLACMRPLSQLPGSVRAHRGLRTGVHGLHGLR